MRSLGIVLWLLAASAGCALLCDDDSERPTYSCEPLPPGSAGCLGGPLGDARDRVFPIGCSATVKSCSSDNGVRSFSCFPNGGWGELL